MVLAPSRYGRLPNAFVKSAPDHPDGIDAGMRIVPAVFDGQHRFDHARRQR